MKKILFSINILLLSIIPIIGNAQNVYCYDEDFYSITNSFQNEYTNSSFSMFLSLFPLQGTVNTAISQPELGGVLNSPHKSELDSKFNAFIFKMPNFKVYPAFRIDCKKGFLTGLFYCYYNFKTVLVYLDIISYDKSGHIEESTCLPFHLASFYNTKDSCIITYHICGGVFDIEDGVLSFEYESTRVCTPEMANGDCFSDDVKDKATIKKKYRYEILDNGCLRQLP